VNILGDYVVEADESFALNFSNPVNATIGTPVAYGIILNDDVAVTVSVGNEQVLEGGPGNTALVFTAVLSAPSPAPVSVDYATANGTATAGSDFDNVSGNVIFAPGETSKPISV